MAVTHEQLKAVRDAIPPEILEAIVNRELDERRAAKAAERSEKIMVEHPPQPATGRYAAVRSGAHKRRSRPIVAQVEDRAYVAGALRHWRRVHGLTQRQAAERIGYSPTAASWRHWEQGFVAPPYRVLLLIIASSGLGYWVDKDNMANVEGDLRLEMVRGREQ